MKTKYNTDTVSQILNECDGRRLNRVSFEYSDYARRSGWARIHKDDIGQEWINLTPKGVAKLKQLEVSAI